MYLFDQQIFEWRRYGTFPRSSIMTVTIWFIAFSASSPNSESVQVLRPGCSLEMEALPWFKLLIWTIRDCAPKSTGKPRSFFWYYRPSLSFPDFINIQAKYFRTVFGSLPSLTGQHFGVRPASFKALYCASSVFVGPIFFPHLIFPFYPCIKIGYG